MDQMSFAFSPVRERWTRDEAGGVETRELLEVKLHDVSPVTYPAYEETTVSVRSLKVEDLDDEDRRILRALLNSSEADDTSAKDERIQTETPPRAGHLSLSGRARLALVESGESRCNIGCRNEIGDL